MRRRAIARLTRSSEHDWRPDFHAGRPGALRQDSLSGLLSTVSKPNGHMLASPVQWFQESRSKQKAQDGR